MEFFKTIIAPLTFLIKAFDNGTFFKRPMCWFYILSGIISAIIPLYILYYVYDGYVDTLMTYSSGWSKFVIVIMLIAFIVGMLLLSLYGFMFWFDRMKQLDAIVRKGDRMVAIPTFAHYIQTGSECGGMTIIYSATFVSILFFLYMVLTWSFPSFIHIFSTLLTALGIILAGALLGYLVIFIGHVIGEGLRVKAIVGNNVGDMGDIMRAATMVQPEE